ncbi:hypothetical protein BJF78_29220 [Pseudonocardia sp. CNS-139]|nr:hypothetical protein BJF78_29220 [Pseudonocardia sp. CNS-139]
MRIITALNDLDKQHLDALALPYSTDLERAVRAERLAMICAREAAWWGLLARWSYLSGAVDAIHGRAALRARSKCRGDARFWRDLAADWRARAERRPTSDAAGALSNWRELGVTA